MSLIQLDNVHLDRGNDNTDSTPLSSPSIGNRTLQTEKDEQKKNKSDRSSSVKDNGHKRRMEKKRKHSFIDTENTSFSSDDSGRITHESVPGPSEQHQEQQKQEQQGQHEMNNANGRGDFSSTSSLTPQPSSPPTESDPTILKYEVNEKVYVSENGQVYLAKIMKTRFRTTATLGRGRKKHTKSYHPPPRQTLQQAPNMGRFQPFWEYYIHFNGWKKSHDKWCREEVIMKDCERGEELAEISKQRLKKEEMERKERKIHVSKKRKARQKHTAMEKTFTEYFVLPFSLQTVLVDDRKNITRIGRHVAEGYDPVRHNSGTDAGGWTPSRMVHNLPATITVEAILKEFARLGMKQQQRRSKKTKQAQKKKNKMNSLKEESNERTLVIYENFNRDLIELFNAMLPKYLLYQGEREQYTLLWDQKQHKQIEDGAATSKTHNNNINMAKVYSGEFLLRLLIRLPMIISAISETSPSSFKSNDNMGSLLLQWKKCYQEEIQSTGSLISELILFLQKYKTSCFKGKYRTITADEYTQGERLLIEKSKIVCKSS